ncbi:hypothetical protein CEXT_672061 [Caerostris extrusa]|uniref:Uncharacterized protein n=1 Tax=Caerostris extrusa TaxID=172846 RepID=A0AAV4RNN7_CAEEX|nr:hypothetical protein CEXT_672061 [Caerostris extrusa]
MQTQCALFQQFHAVVSQPNAIIRLNGRIKKSVSRIARRTSRYSERPSAVHSDVYIKSQISFSRGLRKERRVTSDSAGIRCQFDCVSNENRRKKSCLIYR